MTFFGIFLFLAGIGSLGYGIYAKNNLEVQARAFFEHGISNPETLFIVLGAIGIVVGLILIIAGATRRKF